MHGKGDFVDFEQCCGRRVNCLNSLVDRSKGICHAGLGGGDFLVDGFAFGDDLLLDGQGREWNVELVSIISI